MDIFDLLHLAISIFIVGSVAFVVFGLIALVFALWDPSWHEPDVEVLSRPDAEETARVCPRCEPTDPDNVIVSPHRRN